MASFGSLNIAYTGLNAHRRRMDVIGENITNVNTPGYHRQRVDLQSIANYSVGVLAGDQARGGGVSADEIARMRNDVLSGHARDQGSKASGAKVAAETLRQLEQVTGGLEEGGLHDQMLSLFNSFEDLAAAPEDGAMRRVILQRAETLAKGFTRTSADIDDVRVRIQDEAEEDVRSINLLSEQIAELDVEILKSTSLASSPNTLLDKRDQLVNELSDLANINVSAMQNGQVSVSVGGQLLVSQGRSSQLEIASVADAGLGALGYNRVTVTNSTGQELSITGGKLGARLNDLNVTIPEARVNLDAAVVDLADQVNTIHRSGSGLDATTGLDLFTVGPLSGQLTISGALTDQPDRVAAAKPTGGVLDNTNAREIARLADDPNGPLATFVNLVGGQAAKVASAEGRAEATGAAKAHADGLALEQSGVSLDEELADLVAAQRSYEASARMISAVDEMMQTLISTGLVGR